MGSKFWLNEEDKALVERVLGNEAAEYFSWLSSNNILLDFPPPGVDLGVQQSVREIIDDSDWTYAVFWQVSKSKSGKSALIWGDGHCREPKEGEGQDSNFHTNEKSMEREIRRRVLHKIHAYFGGLNDDNVASKLDRVSDVVLFYLTSMYFAFPFDKASIPSQSFNSSRTIWECDIKSCLERYETRSFLANLAGLKTVVFVPSKSGVLELGSRKSIPEDKAIIHSAKSIIVKQQSSSQAIRAVPRIFGQDISIGVSRSGPISISFSPKLEDDSVISAESYDLHASNGHQNDESALVSNTEQGRDYHLHLDASQHRY